MLGHVYRIAHSFEQQHGITPNLLYLNPVHCEYLLAAFDEKYAMPEIMEMLCMEVIIDSESVHPRVAWTQTAQKMAS